MHTYPLGQGILSSQYTKQRPRSQIAALPARDGQSESVHGSTAFLQDGPFVHCGSQILDIAVKRHMAPSAQA